MGLSRERPASGVEGNTLAPHLSGEAEAHPETGALSDDPWIKGTERTGRMRELLAAEEPRPGVRLWQKAGEPRAA